MSKAVKQLMVEELTRRLSGVDGLLAATTMGMTAEETVRFRAALRAKKVKALVVKNSMCARAFDALGMSQAKGLLDGPTTLIYAGESIAETAKVLVEAAREYPVLKIGRGLMGGALLEAEDVRALSRLPSRAEMVGLIVGSLLGPATAVASALVGPARQVAGQIGQLADRAEEKQAA